MRYNLWLRYNINSSFAGSKYIARESVYRIVMQYIANSAWEFISLPLSLRTMGKVVLFKLKGACVKLIVGSLFGDELIVVATLNDFAVVEHHNNVAVHNG